MAVRVEAIAEMRRRGQNGGIHVVPGDLRASTGQFHQAVELFTSAQRSFVETLHPRHYGVVIYGSARLDPSTPEYAFARNLSQALVARTGCDIITGGGPGIMQAAAEGGRLARQDAERTGQILDSMNHGIRVDLPFEQGANRFIDEATLHPGFPTRLEEFHARGNAFYVAPGGIGSALELLTAMQLGQVGHIEDDVPIIAHPIWEPVVASMKQVMFQDRVQSGLVPLVSDGDFNRIVFTDSIPQIVDIIGRHNDEWKSTIRDKVKKEDVQLQL